MASTIETRLITTRTSNGSEIQAYPNLVEVKSSIKIVPWGQPLDKPTTEPGASLYEVAKVMERYALGRRTPTHK